MSLSGISRAQVLLEEADRAQLTLVAAAIAFYALLSIIPLAMLVVAVATIIGGEAFVDILVSTFDHLATDEGIEIVRTGLEADAGRSGATLGGLLFAAWGSLRVFRGLDRGFNSIYQRPGAETLLETLMNAVAVLFVVVGIVLALGVAFAGLYMVGLAIPNVLIPLVLAPVIAIIFVPMYRVFPPTPQTVRDVIPGSVVAGFGVTIAVAGMQVYVSLASPFAVYGVLAGVFVAMLWLYVIAIVILIGALVNATDFGKDRQLHDNSPSVSNHE